MTITLQALSLVGKGGLGPKFASHYPWGTDKVSECKMGGKVYMDSYMASYGSCLMLTWTISKNPSRGGRPNTKLGDHSITNVHNCWVILIYHVWGPVWIGLHWNNIWLRARSHMTSHTMLEVCKDGLWTLSFGLPQFHGHGSWLVCEVALRGASHYGRRSRGRWFPPIKLQETKSSASRPFTLWPQSKGRHNLKWLLFEEGDIPLKEERVGWEWKPKLYRTRKAGSAENNSPKKCRINK
jgi:hypothetical protein